MTMPNADAIVLLGMFGILLLLLAYAVKYHGTRQPEARSAQESVSYFLSGWL
jgi:hypothetical protein